MVHVSTLVLKVNADKYLIPTLEDLKFWGYKKIFKKLGLPSRSSQDLEGEQKPKYAIPVTRISILYGSTRHSVSPLQTMWSKR